MSDEYVLIKRGLYYGPNHSGYVGLLAQAGLYDEEFAAAYCANPEHGVSFMHVSDAPRFAPGCWEETKIKVLETEHQRMQAALNHIMGGWGACGDDYQDPEGFGLWEYCHRALGLDEPASPTTNGEGG